MESEDLDGTAKKGKGESVMGMYICSIFPFGRASALAKQPFWFFGESRKSREN